MYRNAEETLEKIFNCMNLLVNERDLHNTLRILTNLGTTLVDSDRASSGIGIRPRSSIGHWQAPERTELLWMREQVLLEHP